MVQGSIGNAAIDQHEQVNVDGVAASGETGSLTPPCGSIYSVIGKISDTGFDVTNVVDTVVPGTFDPAYADSAIALTSGSSFYDFWIYPNGTAWLHFDLYVEQLISGDWVDFIIFRGYGDWIKLQIGYGTYRLAVDSTGYGYWVYLTPFEITPEALHSIDFQIVQGDIWSASVYVDNAIMSSYSWGPVAYTELLYATVNGFGNYVEPDYSYLYISQWILTINTPTLGAKVIYTRPVADGSLQQWAGNYTDIDEVLIDTGTYISSDTPSTTSTFDWEPITVPEGLYVNAVLPSFGGLAWPYSDSGVDLITAIAIVMRDAGVSYGDPNNWWSYSWSSTSEFKISGRFEKNPNTGKNWTAEDINQFEKGIGLYDGTITSEIKVYIGTTYVALTTTPLCGHDAYPDGVSAQGRVGIATVVTNQPGRRGRKQLINT